MGRTMGVRVRLHIITLIVPVWGPRWGAVSWLLHLHLLFHHLLHWFTHGCWVLGAQVRLSAASWGPGNGGLSENWSNTHSLNIFLFVCLLTVSWLPWVASLLFLVFLIISLYSLTCFLWVPVHLGNSCSVNYVFRIFLCRFISSAKDTEFCSANCKLVELLLFFSIIRVMWRHFTPSLYIYKRLAPQWHTHYVSPFFLPIFLVI